MPQARGSLSQLVMLDETTLGVANGTNALRLPFISYDVKLTQPLKRSRALQGNRNPTIPYLDEKSLGGSLVIQPDVRSISHVLRHAIGVPVTTGIGPYVHEYKPGTLPVGFTLEPYFSDLALALQHAGCRINGFSFEVGTSGCLEMTLDIVGVDETNVARLDAAPVLYAVSPLKLGNAILSQTGAAIVTATKFGVNFSNDIEQVRTVGNAGKVHSLPEGFAIPSGSLEVLFESMAQYNKAKNETEDSLKIEFPSAATGAGHELEFEFQEVRYSVSGPPIPGPTGIRCMLDWEAHYDNGAAAASIVARVTNDLATVASIPA